jgi:hypothetical protein
VKLLPAGSSDSAFSATAPVSFVVESLKISRLMFEVATAPLIAAKAPAAPVSDE